VSFKIENGQVLALVGESGCGKSVTAFSILQLLQMPPAAILSRRWLAQRGQAAPDGKFLYDGQNIEPSSIQLEGRELLDLDDRQMRSIRGGKISMIFQEPMSSLNPVYTCGSQIVEAIQLHRPMSRAAAHSLAIDLLGQVGIPAPVDRFFEYPHQLSGGMRQRVMIAMALSCDPKLLIADEPTTALDVTIQAQILDLLRDLQRKGLSIMLITHDLAVVAQVADVVGVMYASKIVELAKTAELFATPLHPYTRGLFRSIPRLGQARTRLDAIPGAVPNPLRFPKGCKFHPRCDACVDRCRVEEPELREVLPGHWAACWSVKGYDTAPATDPSR
jgi:oligopeptide/dipeptide ABC transporter ATP-binding protein